MREYLEALEHHPHPLTDNAQTAFVPGKHGTFEFDLAGFYRLQSIGTSEQRRFPRSGRSNKAYDLAGVHVERYAVKRLELAVSLDDAAVPDDFRPIDLRALHHAVVIRHSASAY